MAGCESQTEKVSKDEKDFKKVKPAEQIPVSLLVTLLWWSWQSILTVNYGFSSAEHFLPNLCLFMLIFPQKPQLEVQFLIIFPHCRDTVARETWIRILKLWWIVRKKRRKEEWEKIPLRVGIEPLTFLQLSSWQAAALTTALQPLPTHPYLLCSYLAF